MALTYITLENPYSEGSIEVEGANYEKMFRKWSGTNFLSMQEVKTLKFGWYK